MDRSGWIVRAGAIGLAAGALSGLFGVGGGIVIVPGLVLLSRMDQRLAHGTSLAAILPIAASGAVGFATAGSVDWPVAAFLAGGGMIGAAVGTGVLQRAPEHALRIGFAVLLLITAGALFLRLGDDPGRGPLVAGLALGLVALGAGAGILAGLFGVGGGAVVVPALVLLYALPDAIAKGTSLLVIIPTAVVGTIRNVRFGNAELPMAALIGVIGAITAFVFARVAVRLDPAVSGLLFGGLLVSVAVQLLSQQKPLEP